MKRTISLEKYREKMMQDPEFKKEYFKRDLKFEISELVIEARVWKGLTQEKLAKLIKTKQTSIARLEGGNRLPSLSFLDKIAKSIGTYIVIRFGFMEERVLNYTHKTDFSRDKDMDVPFVDKLRFLPIDFFASQKAESQSIARSFLVN